MTSATSWARAALNSSASARGVDARAVAARAWARTIDRTRSPSRVPPGSRVESRRGAHAPRAPRRGAGPGRVLPAPSGPSSVMNSRSHRECMHRLGRSVVAAAPRAAGPAARGASGTLPPPTMRDLTDRALDTAAKLGATYADVRVIRRRDESIAVKSGRVEGVAMGETRRLRRPRPRRWRVGLRGERQPRARRGRPGRRAGRPRREGVGDRPAAPGRARRSTARHRDVRDAGRRGPVQDPARDEDLRPRRGGSGRRRRQGRLASPSRSTRPPRVEDVRRDRRQLHRAGDHPGRQPRSRRTRSRATSTSAAATRTPAAATRPAGYEYIRGLDLRGPRRVGRRGGGRAPVRAAAARRAGARSCSTRRCSTSSSTRAAAIRPSSIESSAPRRRMPARAS